MKNYIKKKYYEEALKKDGEKKGLINEKDRKRYIEHKQKANLIDSHIEQINQHINTAVEDIHHRLKKFGKEDKEIKKPLKKQKRI